MMALQDLERGNGFALLDPHGEGFAFDGSTEGQGRHHEVGRRRRWRMDDSERASREGKCRHAAATQDGPRYHRGAAAPGQQSVFVCRWSGDGPFNSSSQRKEEIDKKLPKMPPWRVHDLRRTARSLMSRAGVASDHAERVLGHAIPGIEGVYDRYAYDDEKARALKQLASLVGQILDPSKASVVRLDERRRKRRRS
jgi:hypothetical protein